MSPGKQAEPHQGRSELWATADMARAWLVSDHHTMLRQYSFKLWSSGMAHGTTKGHANAIILHSAPKVDAGQGLDSQRQFQEKATARTLAALADPRLSKVGHIQWWPHNYTANRAVQLGS